MLRNAFENLAVESKQDEAIARLSEILFQLDDATADTVLSVLKDVLIKLDSVGVSGTVALGAATLAALETVSLDAATVAALKTVALDSATIAALQPTEITDPATNSKLESVRLAVNDLEVALSDGNQITRLHPETLAALESLNVTVTNPTNTTDLATEATLEAARLLIAAQNPLTNTELRADPVAVDVGANLSVVASFSSIVSTKNNLDTPLAANATFVGEWEDVRDFAAISVVISTDQYSALNGAVIEFSEDETTVIRSVASTIPSGGGHFVLAPQARYFRVRYTNGTTPQAYLRSEITLRFNAPSLVQQPLGAPITDTNMAGIVKAHLSGRLTTGQWQAIKVNGDGTYAVDPALLTAINSAEAARDADATAAQARLDLLATDTKLEQVRSQAAAAEAARDADATAAQARLDLLATDTKLEQVRSLLAGTLDVDVLQLPPVTISNPTANPETGLAKEATLTQVVSRLSEGVFGYAAGTSAATVDVPANARMRKVSVDASVVADATISINSGPTITVKAGNVFNDELKGVPMGADVVIGGGVDSWYVRWEVVS